MAGKNDGLYNFDQLKVKAAQLSFKRASSEGLSKEEQEELERIRKQLEYAKKDGSNKGTG